MELLRGFVAVLLHVSAEHISKKSRAKRHSYFRRIFRTAFASVELQRDQAGDCIIASSTLGCCVECLGVLEINLGFSDLGLFTALRLEMLV